jgi:outer membrane immunogenic protein
MTMKAKLAFLLAVLAAFAASACAQSAPSQTPASPAPRAEIAAGYSYLHTNAPPGGCGCFSMNGFVLQVGFPVNRRGFSLVGDIDWETRHNVLSTGTSLSLASFALGGRYRLIHGGWEPFGEVMAGGIQASGGYDRIGITQPDSATLSFVGVVGGGLDRRFGSDFAWRVVEVDYFATTFDNGTNDHQNNLRVITGAVIRF